MKAVKQMGFVLIAFLVGGIASQAPFAFADSSSSNPLTAIWDSITALGQRQDRLQAQIDDLKLQVENQHDAGTRSISSSEQQQSGSSSDSSIMIESEVSDQPGLTAIRLTTTNYGPSDAFGVKLTFFYNTNLLEVQSISSEQCEKPTRGIIQCYLGTVRANSKPQIMIMANGKAIGAKANLIADISSVTEDTNPKNNHNEYSFIIGDMKQEVIEPSTPSLTSNLTNVNSSNSSSPIPISNDTTMNVGNKTGTEDRQPLSSQQNATQSSPADAQSNESDQTGTSNTGNSTASAGNDTSSSNTTSTSTPPPQQDNNESSSSTRSDEATGNNSTSEGSGTSNSTSTG